MLRFSRVVSSFIVRNRHDTNHKLGKIGASTHQSHLSRPALVKWLLRRSFASYEDTDNVKIPIPEIPKDKLDIKFVKASSGPGGQNVNKLNTKAEVRFKPKDADWIPKVMLDRFIELNASKINKDGEMIITSIRHRLQAQNLKDCLDKLREYLEEASLIPKERIATEMPQYAKEKRLFVRAENDFFVRISSHVSLFSIKIVG